MVLAPPVTWLVLWVAMLLTDTTRVANEFAQSEKESAAMVCRNGRIVYENDSLFPELFERGYFYCSDWRMREDIESKRYPGQAGAGSN